MFFIFFCRFALGIARNIMKITAIQFDIVWENPQKNRQICTDFIDNAGQTDLIVLPEMFCSGFSTNPSELVIESASETIDWMKIIAKKHNAALCGSLIVSKNKELYNRFCFVTPQGKVTYYNKKHLFAHGGEAEFFSPGNELVSIEYSGMKIRPMICYDLRFPVWTRNTYSRVEKSFAYDLLIFVANWPEKRIHHWEKLLQARAIENQAYVCGVNRVGDDKNGIHYSGSTMIVDPMGDILCKAADNKADVITSKIDTEFLQLIRNKLAFASDWDSFNII
jgi:omega-amidase